jgi:hypothetical protein
MNFQRFYVLGTRLIKRLILIWFHVKIETICDKQHYYKIIGTGMD